jgi:hypothetical protein
MHMGLSVASIMSFFSSGSTLIGSGAAGDFLRLLKRIY